MIKEDKNALIVYNCDYHNIENLKRYSDNYDIFLFTNHNVECDLITIIKNHELSNNDIDENIFYQIFLKNLCLFKKYDYLVISNQLFCDYDKLLNNLNTILNTNKNNDIFCFSHFSNNLISFYHNYCKYAEYNENFLKQIKKYNKLSPDLQIYHTDIIIYKNNDNFSNLINNFINEYETYKNSFEISFSFVLKLGQMNVYNLPLDKDYIANLKQKETTLILKNINTKINYINKILWINLDRSIERKKHMEELFSNVSVPNLRVSAIDGLNLNMENIKINNFTRKMSNFEIACTLSHIKAINILNDTEGDYFMICEDDISFNNIYLFNDDLTTIIQKSPNFDILMINKIYHRYTILEYKYLKWSDYYREGIDYMSGTGCYIISRNGINNICNFCYNKNDTLVINKDIDVADLFIYKYVNTYTYLYNFISTQDDIKSTIHQENMDSHKMSSNIQNNIIYNDILNNDNF